MKGDNISEKGLREIDVVQGCVVETAFIDRQTGEET